MSSKQNTHCPFASSIVIITKIYILYDDGDGEKELLVMFDKTEGAVSCAGLGAGAA
jgi:hypothetical protein